MDTPKRPGPARPERLTLDEFNRARTTGLLYAKRRTGSLAKAEDLVDEAIAAAFDPNDSPWDREKEPDLARHVLATMSRRLPSQRRNEARRNDSGWQAKAADATAKPARTPEELVDEARRWAAAGVVLDDVTAQLRAAGHERPAQVLELWRNEVDEPSEQARVLGCSVDEIYRAREVVRRYVEKALTHES
jgi:DNA-directed RNA polymerase specialized sigma24 family protein